MATRSTRVDPTRATVKGVTKPLDPQVVAAARARIAARGTTAQTATAAPASMAPAPAAPAPQVAAPQPAAPAGPQINQDNATQWEDDSVSGRTAAIIASGSPIMRQARADGMRAAAARGLANSSIAVQSAEDAALRYATPIAMQEAGQAAQRNSVRTDAFFAGDRQGKDIAAAMDRLKTSAGFDTVARKENFGYQGQLNEAGYAAQRQNLQAQLAHATEAQKVDIRAKLQMLDKEIAGQSALSAQGFQQQGQLNQAGFAADMERLDKQISSTEGMQKVALQAEKERMSTAFEFDKAMAAIGNGYQVDLTTLQAGLNSQLQSQANTEQLGRMGKDWEYQTQLATQNGRQALEQIKATGDQRLVEQANTFEASLKELTLNINQRNSEVMASSMLNVLQIEAQLRSALLSNPNISAAQRADYERAIGGMSGPTRDYINGVLGGGSGGAGQSGTAWNGITPLPDGARRGAPGTGDSVIYPRGMSPTGSGGNAGTPDVPPPDSMLGAGERWVKNGTGGWVRQPTGMAPR